ncbi:MAG: XisI protein [Moorea sp. SIOASIH]|uniref:XisI protein n=1 Tax=Moorena sp. SIOASIH TaxID=2607817 RepID=UPI0013BD2DB3|nr:XisI protein [Moorena sp. SIOASIH]NEO41515.1 XisI protein [Moorena sp. SIOASIH]
MEKLEKLQTYRSIIKQLLSQYASYKPSHGDIEIHSIFDTENDHYQVMAIGWDKKERVYGCSVHLEIKNGKIWIQNNNTEWDIGQDLVNMNVPKNDIVIGFQPPSMRQYSGYGTK